MTSPRPALPPLAWATALICLLLLVWDGSGLDLWAAGLAGNSQGFALREHWLLTSGFHEGGRMAAWALLLGLSVAVWWPVGALRRIDQAARIQLVVTALLAVLLVGVLKATSATSCPWDLSVFGGVARYQSHWSAPGQADGGSGHCFPAGHASSAFAFLGGYFVFRRTAPRLARRWLLATLVAGAVLGLAQQIRGAHFMSHTLWTGWLCWCVAWATDAAAARWPRDNHPPGSLLPRAGV